jgi:hypothetical protein
MGWELRKGRPGGAGLPGTTVIVALPVIALSMSVTVSVCSPVVIRLAAAEKVTTPTSPGWNA